MYVPEAGGGRAGRAGPGVGGWVTVLLVLVGYWCGGVGGQEVRVCVEGVPWASGRAPCRKRVGRVSCLDRPAQPSVCVVPRSCVPLGVKL